MWFGISDHPRSSCTTSTAGCRRFFARGLPKPNQAWHSTPWETRYSGIFGGLTGSAAHAYPQTRSQRGEGHDHFHERERITQTFSSLKAWQGRCARVPSSRVQPIAASIGSWQRGCPAAAMGVPQSTQESLQAESSEPDRGRRCRIADAPHGAAGRRHDVSRPSRCRCLADRGHGNQSFRSACRGFTGYDVFMLPRHRRRSRQRGRDGESVS